MNIFKKILCIINFLLLTSSYNANAKINAKINANEWDNLDQDAIQIQEPITYLNEYNEYSVLSPKFKIKLTDFGDLKIIHNKANYTLKEYGVQVLNNNKIYTLFKTTEGIDSKVNLNIIYYDKNIVVFTVSSQSRLAYLPRPEKTSASDLYLYSINNNNFSKLIIFNSSDYINGNNLEYLAGDQITENKSKSYYIYNANILSDKTKKTKKMKVIFDRKLNCISPNNICDSEIFGRFKAEFVGVNKN